MAKRIKRNKKPGLPPGSVVFTGNRKVEKILLHFLQYDATFIEEKELDNHSNIPFQVSTDEKVNWYDIRGIHDTQLIELIGQSFDIHPLILEDIADTHQRPKFDEYESGVFIVIQALAFDQETRQVAREQVAIFFRKGLIVTFQERAEDLLEPVRHRLKGGKGKMRQKVPITWPTRSSIRSWIIIISFWTTSRTLLKPLKKKSWKDRKLTVKERFTP